MRRKGYSAMRINMGTSARRRVLDRLFVSRCTWGTAFVSPVLMSQLILTTNDNGRIFTPLNEKFHHSIFKALITC